MLNQTPFILLAGVRHVVMIDIILYFDDFVVYNPLGSSKKKHKIATYYFTLVNLSTEERSGLNAIHIILLTKSELQREIGLEAILQPFIR